MHRLLALPLCTCPVHEPASCFIRVKTDFFTIHSPLGIAWNLGFPEVRGRCFGVCAAPLDSAQHSMVTVVEELGEKFLREASSSHALTNQADLRTRVLTQP